MLTSPPADPVVVTTKNSLRALIKEAVQEAVADVVERLGASRSGEKEILTNDEAMAFLGLSRGTLARYRKDGTLPYSKVGSVVYYHRQDVLDLVEGRLQRGG